MKNGVFNEAIFRGGVPILIRQENIEAFNRAADDLQREVAIHIRELCALAAESAYACRCDSALLETGRHAEGCVYVICLQIAKVIRNVEVPA